MPTFLGILVEFLTLLMTFFIIILNMTLMGILLIAESILGLFSLIFESVLTLIGVSIFVIGAGIMIMFGASSLGLQLVACTLMFAWISIVSLCYVKGRNHETQKVD
ncbi:hypothetical protein COT97_03250 [Candidatus Falkowbacteria bacterium CG10_big_fil_rev_8_21_14_0_10_39_11]|uniref:Uncharacterized protein n=1 Tax=Candidatus Falkowbacteria bacterium CG10_big_fil_rev_8_21_14_0_10_39_11 TaxID=1974565 RepID=A0A2H0V4P8_9BACT|nr:MAG: hypothetical protein COT97_03250 [Candidatus Falkowbacteria bacterium CG10_big_fil_rev_8_21_14_0_10_39_11]